MRRQAASLSESLTPSTWSNRAIAFRTLARVVHGLLAVLRELKRAGGNTVLLPRAQAPALIRTKLLRSPPALNGSSFLDVLPRGGLLLRGCHSMPPFVNYRLMPLRI
jgi:hypothetical protein